MTSPAHEPGRDRIRNPSINWPQSPEEAFQALLHAAAKRLFDDEFGLNHLWATDSGLGVGRSQEQADWLNQQQELLKARLEDVIDQLDYESRTTPPTT